MRARGLLVCLIFGVGGCGSEPEPVPDALRGASGGGAGTGVAGSMAGSAAAAGTASAGPSGGVAGAVAVAGRGAAGAASIAPAPAGMGAVAGSGAGGSLAAGSGGRGGAAGRAANGGSGGSSAAGSGGGGTAGVGVSGDKFSFFVTSLGGMIELSKNDQGFGGDLRFGESSGLAGADKICSTLAEKSLPGAGAKGWRAFLSASKGGANGGPVHARDRIGKGPWYDRNGRLVASSLDSLLQDRPMDADPAIRNDLPNETGVPNHTDTMSGADDNHDTVTGSSPQGMYDSSSTCSDWTSKETPSGQKGPNVGHSWPSMQSGTSWIKTHSAPGCAPSVALVQMGAGMGTGIGNAGGYGGFYCFALQP